MQWTDENINLLRLVIIIVTLVAITLGPWVFESLWVPGDFPCSTPSVRLDENFCGLPILGIDYFRWWAGGFIGATSSLATGAMPFIDWIREGLLPLVFLLPLLPLFSTLTLIFRRDQLRLPIFNIISWGTSLGICLWIGALNHPRYFFVLWGLWSYIALSTAALLLEVLTLQVKMRAAQANFN